MSVVELKREKEELQTQLGKLKKKTSKVINLNITTPIEMVIRGLNSVMKANPDMDDKSQQDLKTALSMLTSGNLLRPDLMQQMQAGGVDADLGSWLISMQGHSGKRKKGEHVKYPSSPSGRARQPSQIGSGGAWGAKDVRVARVDAQLQVRGEGEEG